MVKMKAEVVLPIHGRFFRGNGECFQSYPSNSHKANHRALNTGVKTQ